MSEFYWDVPAAGFVILPGSNRLEPKSRARSVYQPMDVHGLFRTFASVHCDQVGVLRFANKYGCLGLGESESLDDWTAQIEAMQTAIGLWDTIQTLDAKALAAMVRWTPEGGIEYAGQPTVAVGNLVSMHFKPKDPLPPAHFLLEAWINQKLEGNVSAALVTPLPGIELTGHKLDQSTQRLDLLPRTLLAALWLQLANALVGAKETRKCRGCEEFFQVTRGDAKKVFHSHSCKLRDYRKRKESALRLKAAGKTVKQIAADLKATGLETDIDTIKKWIR